MNYAFDSRLGEQLYQLLPEVYRTRDKQADSLVDDTGTNDLAKYLDAHGYLLDLIHATLEQQLKDGLPKASQDWLLPYFAELLAVNIVSPDSDGKHTEVDNAISWRQRKGTLQCAEQIAEAVGQMEVELQEGWKRVAMTPRIGLPIMPAEVIDNTLNIDMEVATDAIRHPGLPAVMVDLRTASRSMEAKPDNPAAKFSTFNGISQLWHHVNRHGVPCFPGSFDDVSRRTVDIRTPDAINGQYHPKRLLTYAPPPNGLFPPSPIQLRWSERNNSVYEHLIEDKEENGIWLIRNKTNRVIIITDEVILNPSKPCRVEGLNFKTKLSVGNGKALELIQVEANEVQVDTVSIQEPVLVATDCLFDELSVGAGPVKLDSCTVLSKSFLTHVEAVDCIFMDITGSDISGVLKNSRIPVAPPVNPETMTIKNCTNDLPVFFNNQTVLNAKVVLSPNTPKTIYAGASDESEMGYFHHGRKEKPVRINGNFTGSRALILPVSYGYALEDVLFEGNVEVTSGVIELNRSAVKSLIVKTALIKDDNNVAIPSLSAINSLFNKITVVDGLSRLEYSTVMKEFNGKYLQASDCIFIGKITDGKGGLPESGCIRYSRIPDDFDGRTLNITTGRSDSNTRAMPVFIKYIFCEDTPSSKRKAKYAEPGYGVLNLATSDGIRFGAEDGGEMGVYHHKYYSLKQEAVMDKIREFLPVGIEPVLIHDARLMKVPPEQIILNGEGS